MQPQRAKHIQQIRDLIGAGRLEEAYTLGTRYAATHKRDPEIHFLLGLIAENTHQYTIARKHASTSLRISQHPDTLFLLSRIDRFLGDTNAALDSCDKALNQSPDSVPLQTHRAGTLEEAGRIDEAHEQITLITEQLQRRSKPIPHEVQSELAKVHVQRSEYAQAADLLKTCIDESTTPPLKRMMLNLLAKAYDRMQQYDDAFKAATRANEIDKIAFDPKLYEQQVSALIEEWSADRLVQFPESTCTDELPVFIAGMPRSGTSLIDQIIDAHPQAAGVGELSTIEQFAMQLDQAYDPDLDPPACFGRYNKHKWSSVAKKYVSSIRKQSPGETQRVVNKALGNNKLVGLIAKLFPNTRIINSIRDPRDIALSCYMGGFNNRVHPWTNQLDWALHACEQSTRMMNHWRASLDVPILDVEYEKLVTSPTTEIPRIIEFLGLEWDDRCLQSHTSRRTVRTLSYDQVTKPMYTSSVGRWKKYESHFESSFKA